MIREEFDMDEVGYTAYGLKKIEEHIGKGNSLNNAEQRMLLLTLNTQVDYHSYVHSCFSDAVDEIQEWVTKELEIETEGYHNLLKKIKLRIEMLKAPIEIGDVL